MLRIIKCKNLLLKKLSTFPMTNLKSTKGKTTFISEAKCLVIFGTKMLFQK